MTALDRPAFGSLLGARREDPDDDRTYFAPTDPVVIGGSVVCGFSHTSMDSIHVAASALDRWAGDEALADAVRKELRMDAATSGLNIEVTVEDRVAYLHGQVAGMEDVDTVEEVVGRLSQLAEVIEELEISAS